MSKSSKKKGRVPKITEAEYAEYISALKAEEPIKITPMENKQEREVEKPQV